MNPDGSQAGAGRIGPRLPSDSDGAGSTDSKAHFKNRAQDLQDPEFQRSARYWHAHVPCLTVSFATHYTSLKNLGMFFLKAHLLTVKTHHWYWLKTRG